MSGRRRPVNQQTNPNADHENKTKEEIQESKGEKPLKTGTETLTKSSALTLEYAIDKIGTNSGASTEDCGIAHLLSELLSMFFELGMGLSIGSDCGDWHGTALADFKRHIAVTRRRGNSCLLVDDIYIAPREDTLHTGPFVTTAPPVIVHVFENLNPIMRIQGQVPGVSRSIGV